MSKYIKLEDAISKIVNTPTRVITDDLTALVDRQHEIIDMLADLPTIEVSEEVLKATKNFNAYTIADENAEMGMRTQIEPIVEVSEDCISREWVLQMLTTYEKDRSSANELDEWQNRVVEWIEMDVKDAPSVVPSRAEGEWIPRHHQGVDKLICECSNCHTLHAITNYCPNCGAKMKG